MKSASKTAIEQHSLVVSENSDTAVQKLIEVDSDGNAKLTQLINISGLTRIRNPVLLLREICLFSSIILPGYYTSRFQPRLIEENAAW